MYKNYECFKDKGVSYAIDDFNTFHNKTAVMY